MVNADDEIQHMDHCWKKFEKTIKEIADDVIGGRQRTTN